MRSPLLALPLILIPAAALAHPGHGTDWPFLQGLIHPLSGMDHLLAMVAVGLWAAVSGGRAMWAMPLVFVAAMLTGGGMGWAGMPMIAVEPLILASVILLGVAAALALRTPLAVALAAVALFGIAHGYAHGVEGPATGLLAYATGFATATTALHLLGLALGAGLIRLSQPTVARGLGAATAFAGLSLALGWA